MEKKELEKYVVIIFLLILIYLCYSILKPFLNALLASAILAYLFHPLFLKINEKVKNRYISSGLTTALVVILIVLPLVGVINVLIREASNAYHSGAVNAVSSFITSALGDVEVGSITSSFLSRAINYLVNWASDFVVNIPTTILRAIILVYALFHFLMSGESIVEVIKEHLPLKNKEKVMKQLGETTKGVVYGVFVIALVDAILTSIVFRMLGLNNSLLWGLLVGILAILPLLGTGLVWIPFAILEGIKGNYTAVIILLSLGVALTLIDYLGRPWIIGKKTTIHPLVVYLGVAGGLYVFGITGLIVGPLCLSFLAICIEEYYVKAN